MRVRYSMYGDNVASLISSPYRCKCDMSNRKAREMYEELKTYTWCEWAELVGEDEDDYMQTYESFDRWDEVRKFAKAIESLGFSARDMANREAQGLD